MQGFFEFEIVVASVPQSNKPNPVKVFFSFFFQPSFVRIAVDMILFILFKFYFIMQLQQKEQRMSLGQCLLLQMSSAKNLGTCNLKDCIKISGSSFRRGFIWGIQLLSWRLMGESLDKPP